MTIEQQLMSAKQVATVLNISKGSVYRMINQNEIPSVIIGSRKLIPTESVERLLRHSKKTVEASKQAVTTAKKTREEATAALMRAAEALQAAAQAIG